MTKDKSNKYIPQLSDVFNALVRCANEKVAIGCPCICIKVLGHLVVAKEKYAETTIREFNFNDFTFAKVVKETNRGEPARDEKNK